MQRSRLAVLFIPVLALLAPTVRAQDPSVVIRVKSLNALLPSVNLVVKLLGQEEAANQIEGLIKSKIGKNGLEGIDPARPFGAYVRFGKSLDDINGAILIPIANDKAFLNLLDNVGVNYAKDKAGLYTHKTNKNIDLYFRFAQRYLYITAAKYESILDKNLVDPAKVLALTGDATISLVARVDQIPDAVKLIALAGLSEGLENAQKSKPPNETKWQAEFRVALLRELNKLGSSVIREAAEVRLDLDVADAAKMMNVHFAITGKPGSDLAKSIDALGKLQSPLAGLVDKNVAFLGSTNLALPASLRKALNDLIDEAAAKSLANIQNAAKKQQAETLFKAIMPTAKAGDFQIMAALLGPQADRYTVLAGLKLKDGAKLGATVRGLVKDSLNDLAPQFRAKIALDIDRVGAVQIDKFDLPKDASTDKLLEIFGDTSIYIAFRDDALLVAMGKQALPTLKTALAKAGSGASVPLIFDFDVARMAKWTAQTPEQKALAERLFAAGQNGRMRLSIAGGATLTVRLQLPLSVLEYLAKLKKDKE